MRVPQTNGNAALGTCAQSASLFTWRWPSLLHLSQRLGQAVADGVQQASIDSLGVIRGQQQAVREGTGRPFNQPDIAFAQRGQVWPVFEVVEAKAEQGLCEGLIAVGIESVMQRRAQRAIEGNFELYARHRSRERRDGIARPAVVIANSHPENALHPWHTRQFAHRGKAAAGRHSQQRRCVKA